jgi:hypothetical protein
MLTKPRWLLHLEGACVLLVVVYAYSAHGYRWWLFAVLFLAPDLFMLGYLANAKIGAAIYNIIHTESLPLLLILFGFVRSDSRLLPYALIWLAHIAFDRMLGFGLKYPTTFNDTHLQHV